MSDFEDLVRRMTAAGPVRDPGQYVTGTTAGCRQGGCQARELLRLAEGFAAQAGEAIEKMTTTEGERVSVQPTAALWCEQGAHSFSEKDPGMQVITIAGRGPDGEPAAESRTCCGQCAAETKTAIGAARHAQAPAAIQHGHHDERPVF